MTTEKDCATTAEEAAVLRYLKTKLASLTAQRQQAAVDLEQYVQQAASRLGLQGEVVLNFATMVFEKNGNKEKVAVQEQS